MLSSVGQLQLLVLLMSTLVDGASITSSYPCPDECECTQRQKNMLIVDVVCHLSKIGPRSNFSVLQTNVPTVLYIICDPFSKSELRNFLFRDLKSVIELKFVECKFSFIPKFTFSGMDSLEEILIDSAVNLRFHRNAFDDCKILTKLHVTNSQVRNMADLCQVSSLRFLNLTENDLQNISSVGLSCTDDKTLPKLSTLILNKNSFQKLESDFGNAMPNLWELSIAHNYIELVDSNAVKFLSNLGWIDLTNNSIQQFPPDFLLGKNNLRIIGLSGNQLGNLPQNFFSFSTKLIIMDLRNTNLNDTIWDALSSLRHVKQLELGENSLTRVDRATLYQLPDLHYLDFQRNKIRGLNEDMFAYQSRLQRLILSDNELSEVESSAFDGLKSLAKLDLSKNKISYIDDDTFHPLGSLVYLNLSSNALQKLPEVRNMKTLKILDIGFNRLENISETFLEGMLRLEEIHLQFNFIDLVLKNAFQSAPSLKYINLGNNRIEMIEHYAFDGLPQLTWLNLRNNRIQILDGVFNYMQSLDYLDLSKNGITADVSDGLFPYTIKNLNLNGNKITKLNRYSFYKYKELINVDLRHNEIKTFKMNDIAVSQNMATPPSFLIVGNPFTCDCNLKWLRKRMNGEIPNAGEPVLDDLDDVMCKEGFRVTTAVLLSTIDPEDMMCQYDHECQRSSCLCCDFSPCICVYKCPDRCSCFKSENEDGNSVVVCSESNKTVIPPDIPSIAKQLYMDGNHIPIIHRGVFLNLMYLTEMYLNHSGIVTIQNGTFDGLNQLQKLYLHNNHITEITSDTFDGADKLEELHLESNEITNIDDGAFNSMFRLRSLYLANNRLSSIPEAIVPWKSRLQIFTLSGNYWSCDCEILSIFWEYLSESKKKIKDLSNVKCNPQMKQNISTEDMHDDAISSLVLGVDIRAICPNINVTLDEFVNISIGRLETSRKRSVNNNFVVIVAVCAAVVMFILILVVLYWRWTLFHQCQYHLPLENSESLKEYDVFISYSKSDSEFVIKEFVTKLESGNMNYNVCLVHRDFPIVRSVADAIKGNICRSKTVILILSSNLLNEEWRQKDFRLAHSAAFANKGVKLVIILLHNIDLRKLNRNTKSILKKGTYLRYRDKLFWEKIDSFMPETAKAEFQTVGLHGLRTPDLLRGVGEDFPIFDEGYETPVGSSAGSHNGNGHDSGFELENINNIYEEIGPKTDIVA